MDYFEAAAFAATLGCQLPTQVERHYAALAGREGDDICGVSGDGKLRFNNAQWSPEGHLKNGPAKVGSFDPTPWGHHDLTGNNWEWVRFKEVLQGFSGGAWVNNRPRDFWTACFNRSNVENRGHNLGFRVARSCP